MKELHLEEDILTNQDNDVCAGELINCLHNLRELKLELKLNISPEIKSKLETCGDAVGCKVVFINET